MNSSVPDLSLVLACYNEEGLFRQSVAEILQVLDTSRLTYEIIFVDDKSTDGTAKLIRSVVTKNKRTRALYHDTNMGRGRTVTDGIRAAKGTVVGYIDIDCEVSPVYVTAMVSKIRSGRADVVIGKRYYRTSPGSLVREVLSRGYQWISSSMIGTGGLDTESGYKFFRRKKILPVLAFATHPGWFWDTEIVVFARRAGLTVLEYPVLFLRRFDKISSVNVVRDTADYMVQLVHLRAKLRR